jgi:hypothetical protein
MNSVRAIVSLSVAGLIVDLSTYIKDNKLADVIDGMGDVDDSARPVWV